MASSEASETGRNSEDTVLTTVRRRKLCSRDAACRVSPNLFSCEASSSDFIKKLFYKFAAHRRCKSPQHRFAYGERLMCDRDKLSGILPLLVHPFPSPTRQ